MFHGYVSHTQRVVLIRMDSTTQCISDAFCGSPLVSILFADELQIGYLVGGLEHFLFFDILGIIIPTD